MLSPLLFMRILAPNLKVLRVQGNIFDLALDKIQFVYYNIQCQH